MTSKKSKENVRWTEACTAWRDRLWLGQWRINTEIADAQLKEGRQRFDCVAEAHFVPSYKEATITAEREFVRTTDEDRLQEVAAHEMSHLILARMDTLVGNIIKELPASKQGFMENLYDEEKEAVTTHITEIVTSAKWADEPP